MRHDLAGPQIGRMRRPKYIKELKREFNNRARAAHKAKEIAVCADQLDILCEHAATDCIRMREIAAAHRSGKLPTDVMRQLPAFEDPEVARRWLETRTGSFGGQRPLSVAMRVGGEKKVLKELLDWHKNSREENPDPIRVF